MNRLKLLIVSKRNQTFALRKNKRHFEQLFFLNYFTYFFVFLIVEVRWKKKLEDVSLFFFKQKDIMLILDFVLFQWSGLVQCLVPSSDKSSLALFFLPKKLGLVFLLKNLILFFCWKKNKLFLLLARSGSFN